MKKGLRSSEKHPVTHVLKLSSDDLALKGERGGMSLIQGIPGIAGTSGITQMEAPTLG